MQMIVSETNRYVKQFIHEWKADITWTQYLQHQRKLRQHGCVSASNLTKFDEKQGIFAKHAHHNLHYV